MNVHGHLHEQESPVPNRQINVSVEQLDYRPARMSDIRQLAAGCSKVDDPGAHDPGAATGGRAGDAVTREERRRWKDRAEIATRCDFGSEEGERADGREAGRETTR